MKSFHKIILYNTLIYQVNIPIKSHFKSVRLRYNNKLIKFWESQQKYNKSTTQTELVRNIVHNFSPHALSHKEFNVLSYGLDYHISIKANKNAVSRISWIFPTFRKVNLRKLKLILEIHVKDIAMSKYRNIKRMSLII